MNRPRPSGRRGEPVEPWLARDFATQAVLVSPVREVPTGWNLHARHPDGLVAEYVQHRVVHAPSVGAGAG